MTTYVEDYYPEVSVRLLNRALKINAKKIVLFGFSDNMKWLFRLFIERSITPTLTDWRTEYIEYDCGGQKLTHIEDVEDCLDTLLIVCIEEINTLKNAINFLYHLGKNKIKVIYDRTDRNIPLRQEEPYNTIFEKAYERRPSISSDAQLFYLIQCIDQIKDVSGDILEYGTYNGGSGAIIAEATKIFGKKNIWLFDSFEGIPDSKYGLDYHWNRSFSNNSFSEVKNAFSDMDNVNVIKGNISETYNTATDGKISFGYLGSDTLESGELLLNYMWPKLNPGGFIVIADYGSFPNAIPLTVYVDEFIKSISSNSFVFRTDNLGIYIMKHRI
jgi:hypothetical protein